MPETVEQNKWLSAVAGLENARQWDAAELGYTTAIELWDKSFIAWMGLGNSLYNQNNLIASTEAFERATELQPENGMAYNNLAHVLAEQGRLDEALAAARRAVAIGGPFQETFSQTLEEVELMLKD
jgi:tetratricopeptide (TPR) repeat protein